MDTANAAVLASAQWRRCVFSNLINHSLQHINSHQHKLFALEDNNYRQIDNFIAEKYGRK